MDYIVLLLRAVLNLCFRVQGQIRISVGGLASEAKHHRTERLLEHRILFFVFAEHATRISVLVLRDG